MPVQNFRVGVAGVRISKKTSLVLGAATGLDCTATVIDADEKLLNSIDSDLPTSTTIKTCWGLLGRDAEFGGYTVTPVSDESDALTTEPGKLIKVVIPNADFPANMGNAAAVVLFIKEGNGDYQIARFSYVDPSKDFVSFIGNMPQSGNQTYAYSTLVGSVADEDLGSRAPFGYSFVTLAPTTGGVQVTREVDEATLDPDTSRAFSVATTRSTTIKFSLMANGVIDIVRAAGGNFFRASHSGIVYEEALQSIATANAIITGNQPFMLILPRDAQGWQERRLYLGGLTTNQTGFTEEWLKSNNASVDYVFSTAIMDKLLIDQYCEIVFKRKG